MSSDTNNWSSASPLSVLGSGKAQPVAGGPMIETVPVVELTTDAVRDFVSGLETYCALPRLVATAVPTRAVRPVCARPLARSSQQIGGDDGLTYAGRHNPEPKPASRCSNKTCPQAQTNNGASAPRAKEAKLARGVCSETSTPQRRRRRQCNTGGVWQGKEEPAPLARKEQTPAEWLAAPSHWKGAGRVVAEWAVPMRASSRYTECVIPRRACRS